MRINEVDAYTSPAVNRAERPLESIDQLRNGVKNSANAAKQNFQDSGEVVTRTERNFFKNMFPESSDQIERHVLFNRNGRIQAADITKGSIFDGRA